MSARVAYGREEEVCFAEDFLFDFSCRPKSIIAFLPPDNIRFSPVAMSNSVPDSPDQYALRMVNIDKYGNTTAGTIPLGLWDATRQGRLKKGDLVLLVAVGAGYTTGGVLLRWAY